MGLKVDKIDKKLLYYLTQNARLSYTTLSENVGLSREAVKLRIEGMVRDNVILAFRSQSSHPYFGLEFYHLYISFTRLDSKRNAEYESYIKRHKSVLWSNRCLGKWDYAIFLIVKDNYDLAKIISEFKEKFSGFIKDIEHDAVLYEYVYRAQVPEFFKGADAKPLRVAKDDSSFYRLLENAPTTVLKERLHTTLDRTDVQILEILSANCRMPIHEMGARLGVADENIRYRMKRMVERSAIVSFWAVINYDLFGLHWYRIKIRTNRLGGPSEKRLSAFLQNHPNVFWSSRSVGKIDMHIDIRVTDNNRLNDFLGEFNSRFDDLVIDYETLIMTQPSQHNNFAAKMYEIAK